jgi:biotin operon repressor
MVYEQSQEIEARLKKVLRLIRRGGYSTPKLAARLGVSVPTISRCIESLRDRGYAIRSVRMRDAWRYVLDGAPDSTGHGFEGDRGSGDQVSALRR